MRSFACVYIMVVFGCKYRLALIDERWQYDLYRLCATIVDQYGKGSKLLAAGGIFDHVHLLISVSQNISLSELMREVKSRTSAWINSRRLCRGRFGWQTGCSYFSVSASSLAAVERYISNQKEHHRGAGFRQEMEALYRKHGFEFSQFNLPEDLE